MEPLKILLRTVNGLEKVASEEICEKLRVDSIELSPYCPRGWIKARIEGSSLEHVRKLRSVAEAYTILHEEGYGEGFSIDQFADKAIEAVPAQAPAALKFSVSAYSVRGRPSQRRIQGAFSRRIVGKLKAECNFKDYDTALRITLLKNKAVAMIDLQIQPGNITQKFVTHPTPLFPPIAYCMIRLCSPQRNERLLDPMCGCGTIPLMAALEWTDIEVKGADAEEEYVACAKKNAEMLGVEGKTSFSVSDIGSLASKGVKADMIAVNPPYGIALPTRTGVDHLYRILFEQVSTILPSAGRMIIVTPYPAMVEKWASSQMLKIVSIYRILEGDLPRAVQLIKKSR